MSDPSRQLDQRARLAILIFYVAGLLIASKLALGAWLPPTSEKGVWFYSALAALLLGNLLVTPFFTKPADAISYSVAATIALLAVNIWARTEPTGFDRFLWSTVFAYVVVVLITGVFSIALKDSANYHRVSRSCFLISDSLGSPRAIFSMVFLFALITYHRSEAREYLVIGVAWVVFVGLRPLEGLAGLVRRLRMLWSQKEGTTRLGEIVGHESPGVTLVRQEPMTSASLGDLLLVRTESGTPGAAVSLDHVGFADGRWLRALQLSAPSIPNLISSVGPLAREVSNGTVFAVENMTVGADLEKDAEDARARLLGLVAPQTTIGQLQFEIVRTDLSLRRGRLVEVSIDSRPVLYQIIEGITKEEILHQKNTRGFVCAQGKKIGCWNSSQSTFDNTPWLPQPNTPVFLASCQAGAVTRDAVGHFPDTSYPVSIDPHLLVTHNAAILGILGVGKTFLALELVERMIKANIKVICLDLTDQYAQKLAPFYDATAEQSRRDDLLTIGPSGKTNVNRNVEEGGSVRNFAAKIKEHLEAFLASDGTERLKIFNPAQFEVWRQDSRPFNDQASMATLTPTEITRIITETALEVLQGQGMAEMAKCCIVYEEAHSLIPEWSAVASEGDKSATNGTAKAILQGRKFGLGCLVVTQRTANVTKSILNQCNTVFALRVFDATGMEFLKNYIGEDYAGVLSTLEDRHAVLFGRASSCSDPVLLRLNDRDEFVQAFRPDRETEDVSEGSE